MTILAIRSGRADPKAPVSGAPSIEPSFDPVLTTTPPQPTITIISPYGGKGGQPRNQTFTVAGVFHSGMYEFDARMVFIELGEAQRYF